MESKIILSIVALSLSAVNSITAKQIADGAIPGVAAQPASYFYTGKPYDRDLNAYVFHYRNYDPSISRWTSADPSGFPDGANGQIYAPSVLIELDPDGLETKSVTTSWVGEVYAAYPTSTGFVTYTYPINITAVVTVDYTKTGSGENASITINSVSSSQDSGLSGSVGWLEWSFGTFTTYSATSSVQNGVPVVTVDWKITSNFDLGVQTPFIDLIGDWGRISDPEKKAQGFIVIE